MDLNHMLHLRWFGTRARLAPLKKMMEFRQGPFSALRPPDAPKQPAIPSQPAKIRLAHSDAAEAVSSKHLFILQNISISSNALQRLKLRIKEISSFKIKMIPPAVLSQALSSHSPKIKEQDLTWISGPTFVAYTNETNALKVRAAFLALKAEPFLLLLGGRFEEFLFTHEGLEDLLRRLPQSKEHLHLELVSLLEETTQSLTNVLSSPPISLLAALKGLETRLANK